MAMDGDYDNPNVSDQEKVRIASDFILHAPPGEFNEVFNDVRVLVNNDALLKEGVSASVAQYNKEQLTPVKVQDSDVQALVTEYNDIGSGRFYDPRSKQTFKFDHLRKEASDFQGWTPDSKIETWRAALEEQITSYVSDHYRGVCSVFGKSQGSAVTFTVCVESHEFQPKNFWNGKWRSVWSINMPQGAVAGTEADVRGLLRVHFHYYEDGNVQLVSSKDVKQSVVITDELQTAQEITRIVNDAENEYQVAIVENYQTMSETTFKALRRLLPVTRTKIDWNKILSYSIGKELNRQ